jgi:hypothetical protein
VIEIIGEVTDMTELHDYVAQLGASSLVDQAQIKSLEAATAESKNRTTQFILRIRLRPNFCQPGGVPDPKRPVSPSASEGTTQAQSASEGNRFASLALQACNYKAGCQ